MRPDSTAGRRTLGIALVILTVMLIPLMDLAFRPAPERRLVVVGQPESVGPIQAAIEKPFFEQLAATTGARLKIEYAPSDGTIADAARLDQLRRGAIDLVSLRIPEAATTEPSLASLDVAGYSANLQEARQRAESLLAPINEEVNRRWNARLLGVWAMGPQLIMCNKAVARLSDLRGLRIRVAGEAQARFVYSQHAIPARIPFAAVMRALNDGLVDCAISSLTSARAAGWLPHVSHALNIPVQFAVNGYAISDAAWVAIAPEDQDRLTAAMKAHASRMWAYAQRLHEDELACHLYGSGCPAPAARRLNVAQPDAEDLDAIRRHSRAAGHPNEPPSRPG